MTRYYFNHEFFYHFAHLCNAYFKQKGHYPLKAVKTKDSKGEWILVYK